MKKLLLAAILAAIMGIAGTASADDAAEVPYFEVEAQLVGMDVIGLVPEGLRIDGHTRGVVTDGLFEGFTTTGVDYMVLRHDGVTIIDARWLVVGPDGVTVALVVKGFGGEPSPGLLEAMLDPEFEFPDVDRPMHGAAWLQTMAPQYAFLNHSVFGFTGSVNMTEEALRMTFRSLAP